MPSAFCAAVLLGFSGLGLFCRSWRGAVVEGGFSSLSIRLDPISVRGETYKVVRFLVENLSRAPWSLYNATTAR